MTVTCYRGARLLDPAAGIDRQGDLLVDGPRIAAPDAVADRTVDASGLVIAPGAVDLAVRLREPGASHKGTVGSELRAAAAGGSTTVVVPPDTRPVVDDPSVVEWIQDRAARAGLGQVELLAAMTVGLAGEALTALGPMRRAGCRAIMDTGTGRASAQLRRRALLYADTFGLRVIALARDPSLDSDAVAHDGAIATQLGLPASPVSAESAAVAQWIELVAETGVPLHLARLSSGRACELVRRAREDGLPVSADVALHQLFLTEEALLGYNAMAHVRPPLRAASDREALRAAVTDGTVTAICSDHQPHEIDAKTNPLPLTQAGVSSAELLWPLAWQMVEDGVLDAITLAQRLCTGPAAALGAGPPSLEPGAPADLVMLRPDAPWTLSVDAMHSFGRNSPFLGTTLPARVERTLVGGRIVHGTD